MSSLIISSPNSVPLRPLIQIGPFGGNGGDRWDDGSHHDGIRRIDIRSGLWIDSIGCVYDNPDVNVIHHGGDGGSLHSVIPDYPNEYINSFSGHVGKLLVNSFTFSTNYNKTYGPFGTERGIPFSYASDNERIVGFHGRSGIYVDSIGVHMLPSSDNTNPLKKFGPLGGNGGESWDDGAHRGIRRINIRSGGWIDSIGCVYDNPDVNPTHHGGKGGSLHSIKLDYPNEYINSFSGHVGTQEDNKLVVNSLTFSTNYNKTYGTFGVEDGMTFSYASRKEKIVGFHGRSGVYVNSIGVNLLKF